MNDQVTRFLCNSMKTGVHSARLTISYNAIMNCFNYCNDLAKKKRKRLGITVPDKDREFYRFASKSGDPCFMDQTLDSLLNFLVKHDPLCPKEIKEWAGYGVVVAAPEYYSENEPELNKEDDYFFFTQQLYFEDELDALSIAIDSKAGPDLVAEIASLNEGTLQKFNDFVSSVPGFKGQMLFKKEGLQHTQTAVCNLYPAVLGLWVDTLAHKDVKRDVIDYLSNALLYFDKREWRMVIILCALSAESILIDVYETLAKEEAPQAPLGTLLEEINAIRKLPPDIDKCLNTLKSIRNSALHHKGLAVLTRKDALLGLINTAKFSLWWSFNCKDYGK